MKKRFVAVSVALFSVFFISLSAFGQADKITVVYTDWFPYTWQENGQASGFEIETFKAIMKNMNMEAEFVNYPWQRCLFSLQEGKADALISLLKTPEREQFAYFPENYISISKTVLFTTTDKDIKFTGSYEDLKGLLVGVILGFAYSDAFDKATYLQKDESRDAEMMLAKLVKGRNDVGAENQAVVSASARKMGVADKIRFLEPPIHTQKLYVGFSKAKDRKKLCEDFSKQLGEFRNSEAYKAILEKYGVKYSDMAE
ncbi:MAG: transporter substrate-binding domain-containing protein [Desulfobacterales bacterium]